MKVKLSLFLVAQAMCLATTLDLNYKPNMIPFGRIDRHPSPGSLDNTKWEFFLGKDHKITCYFSLCNAEGISLINSRNGSNWSEFKIQNTTNEVLTKVAFLPLSLYPNDVYSRNHGGDYPYFSSLMINLPMDRADRTPGSGAGHVPQGNFMSYALFNQMSPNLWGGIVLKTNKGKNQTLTFRTDLDEGVATPEPTTVGLFGSGLVYCLFKLRRRRSVDKKAVSA